MGASLGSIARESSRRAGSRATTASPSRPGTATYTVALADSTYLACASILEQETFVAPRGMVNQDEERRNRGRHRSRRAISRRVINNRLYTPCFRFSPGSAYVAVDGVTPPESPRPRSESSSGDPLDRYDGLRFPTTHIEKNWEPPP